MKIGDPLRQPDQMFQGQPYWRSGERDHTRRDGSATKLTEWLSFCADCGSPFTLSTAPGPRFEPTRRCVEHRRPGARVAKSARPDRFEAASIRCEAAGVEPAA